MSDAEIERVELELEDKRWTAERTGTAVVTTSGSAGKKGRASRKDYASREEASSALHKAAAKKYKEGFFACDGSLPLPVAVDATGVARVAELVAVEIPAVKQRRPRIRDSMPPQLDEAYRTYGFGYCDGPGSTGIWFARGDEDRVVVMVQRRHELREVTPRLCAARSEFLYSYDPHPVRPDEGAFLTGLRGKLYEVDVASAQARELRAIDAQVGPFEYTPSGEAIVFGAGANLCVLDRATRSERVVADLGGEPVLAIKRLASGRLAVLQGSTLRLFDGALRQTHGIAVRKGVGLGTLHDGRLLMLLTRNHGPRQTVLFAIHDDGVRLVHMTAHATSEAFDLRGASWVIEGDPASARAYRVFNADLVWEASRAKPLHGADEPLEATSLHDAIAAALDDRDPRGMRAVVDALAKATTLEAREYNDKLTPLGYAAWRGALDIARLLIERGAEVNGLGGNGRTPLAAAFERGHLAIADALIAAGAAGALPAQATVDGKQVAVESPLVAAARAGYYDHAVRMLDAGASPDATGHDGASALSAAAARKYPELALLLLERGAAHAPADALLYGVVECQSVELARRIIPTSPSVAGEMGARVLRNALLSRSVGAANAEIIDLLVAHGARNTSPEALHYAVEARHAGAIRALIAGGSDPDAPYPNAMTPSLQLHVAARDKQPAIECIEALLDGGAQIQALDNRGISALRYAIAFAEDSAAILLLLERGAAIERGDGAWGALHEAACADKSAVIDLLLARGAAIDALTREGTSAIAVAAWNRRRSALEHLLAKGADVNAGGFTALMAAAIKDDAEVVAALLAAGADPARRAANPYASPPDAAARTAREHAERAGAEAAASLLRGGVRTLHAAVAADDLDGIRELLAGGADPNQASGSPRRAPLDLARSVAALEALLAAGARPSPETVSFQCQAAHDGLAARVAALLRHVEASQLGHALSTAAARGARDIVEQLLDAGCPVMPTTRGTYTALHGAARGNHADVVRLLCARGARTDVLVKDIHGAGMSPLHEAAAGNAADAARALIACGARVDLHDKAADNYDSGGYNALHRAAEDGHYEVMLVLLEHHHGALHAQVTRGPYADELAKDHPRVLELLEAVSGGQTVAQYLAAQDAARARAREAAEARAFYIERIAEQVPEGTGTAPPAVMQALAKRDWVRATRAGYALVLREVRGLHEVSVGDEQGVHALPITIRAQSIPYAMAPDGRRFLVSDGTVVFEVDAAARTARPLITEDKLDGPVRDVGYAGSGLVVLTRDSLAAFSYADAAAWWRLPGAGIADAFATGSPLMAVKLEANLLVTLWLHVDPSGVRLHSRWNEKVAMIWAYGDDAYAYSSWSAPVSVYRLHHLATATRPPGDPVTALPTREELTGLVETIVAR